MSRLIPQKAKSLAHFCARPMKNNSIYCEASLYGGRRFASEEYQC
jgi:hypothetical protein